MHRLDSTLPNFIRERYHYFLLLIPVTIPWTTPIVNNRILAICAVSVFTLEFALGKLRQPKLNKYDFLLIAFFLLQVIGLLYSQDLKAGLRDIETMIPLIVFPILFGFIKRHVQRNTIRLYLYSFVAGVLITCTLSMIIVLSGWSDQPLFTYLSEHGHVDFSTLVHPTYLGIYAAFSIIFLIDELINNSDHKAIRLLTILLLCAFMILINAKMALLAFIFVLTVYSFLRLKTLRWRVTLLSFIGLFLFILLLYKPTRVRFIEAPLKVFKMGGLVDAFDQPTWSYSFRLQIYTCALDRIAASPIVGYGTGSSNKVLMDCYEEKEYSWMLSRKFNAHNEYFEECLKHGLIGAAILLVLLISPLREAFLKKDYLAGSFILLVMISALTENLLSVQKGVNFIGFFYTVLAMRLRDTN